MLTVVQTKLLHTVSRSHHIGLVTGSVQLFIFRITVQFTDTHITDTHLINISHDVYKVYVMFCGC